MNYYIIWLGVVSSALAQQYSTPVPILKQINKHNEDGSYSYGYEGADGSYKIESKYPNGEVYGKYGYVDDTGKLREIEYGASKRGFEPQGNEIKVAPPTLNDNSARPLGPNEEDDGQYREDPSIYYKDDKYNQRPAQQTSFNRQSFAQQPAFQQPAYQQPAYQQPAYQQPAYQQPAYQQPSLRPTTKFSFDDFLNNQPQAQPQPQPQPRPAPVYQPNYYQPPQPNYYQQPRYNVPATNVDLNLGSYTVNYR